METLQDKLNKANDELVGVLLEGKASVYSNLEQLVWKGGSGAIGRIDSLLARRATLKELLVEENARNKTQKEEKDDANTTRVVG